MQTYLQMVRKVLKDGECRQDRTGVGTRSIFGYQMEFDLELGFPLLTTKALHVPSIIHELLWFISGDSNTEYLKQNGISIWDEWADDKGDLGRIYGAQWRDWRTPDGGSKDQLSEIIDGLNRCPHSRRHILTAWNPGELQQMALPPCHILMQLYVDNDRGLHCQLYQRSADVFLGVPFNIASYALLTHMIAKVTGLIARRFIWSGGDVHIYLDHISQVEEQLTREPKVLPKITLTESDSIFDFDFNSIEIINYAPHPKIAAPIAV